MKHRSNFFQIFPKIKIHSSTTYLAIYVPSAISLNSLTENIRCSSEIYLL